MPGSGRKRAERSFRRRHTLVTATLALGAVILILRLAQIQLLEHPRFSELAQRYHFRRETLPAERGRIFDRNGVLVAYSVENPSIYAVREEIVDLARAIDALHAVGVPREWAAERLKGERGFVWISHDLREEAQLKAAFENVPGLYYRMCPKRVYPWGGTAREIIGRDSEDPALRSGLEDHYDDLLCGESGWQSIIVDAVGGRYATADGRPPQPGRNLFLTLDIHIQEIAELALDAGIEKWGARGGVVLVLDPQSGEIIAMASRKRDAKGLNGCISAITDPFEVGSCAKVVVAASALEEAVCDTAKRFYCGIFPDEEKPPPVRDDHGKPEWLSFQMVIAESRNIGTARIARLVGPGRLYQYLTAFGFGKKTSIELPGESGGLLRRVAQWSGRSLETLAIGHEFSATSLQLAMAYAAVANGGLLLRPRLVRDVDDGGADGRAAPPTSCPEVIRRVVGEETARTLRAILHRATRSGGTGVRADVGWADVAGKTGTARKYVPEIGAYARDRHVASFVGFVPWDAPRYVCVVMIDEPEKGCYGAEVAAPVFCEVIEKVAAVHPEGLRRDVREIDCDPPLVAALSVDGLEAPAADGRRVPDLRGMATNAARKQAALRGFETEVLGTGERVLHQSPRPGSRATGMIVLRTAGEAPTHVAVPNVEGLSLRSAMAALAAVGLKPAAVGKGWVVRQRPPPGEAFPTGGAVEIVLVDRQRDWGVRERS